MSSCECNIYSSISIEALIWICITYMKIPGNEMRFIPNKCNFNNFMLLRIKYEMLSWHTHTHIVFWSVLRLYYIMNVTIKASIYTETYTNILDLEVNQYPITQLKIYTIIHITWILSLWLFLRLAYLNSILSVVWEVFPRVTRFWPQYDNFSRKIHIILVWSIFRTLVRSIICK